VRRYRDREIVGKCHTLVYAKNCVKSILIIPSKNRNDVIDLIEHNFDKVSVLGVEQGLRTRVSVCHSGLGKGSAGKLLDKKIWTQDQDCLQ
jgi:hypothetical protein